MPHWTNSAGYILLVQDSRENVFEMRKIHRLCQVCGESGLPALLDVLIHSKAAHGNRLDRTELSQAAQSVPTRAVRQPEVANNQIRTCVFVLLAGSFDSLRNCDAEAAPPQGAGQDPARVFVIFHDQNGMAAIVANFF